jgi:uncharacterized protein
MPNRLALLCVLPLALSTLNIGGATEALAQQRCRVADPTGTPLNVRTAPNGKIVSTLTNGVLVTVLDHSSHRAKAWAYVGGAEDHVPLGWVFQDYLDCGPEKQVIQVSEPQPTLWDHNGSLVYLIAKGSSREFYYQEPRAGMLEAGARPDSLLFRGKTANGQYSGTAFFFNRRCGTIPYQVSGPILDNYERVVLQGNAPRVGSNCRIQGYVADTLEFRLVKSDEATSGAQQDTPGGPSFNCRYAKAPDEVAICLAPKLGEMDAKLASLYFGFLRLSAGGARRQIEMDEAAWLQQRQACGSDVHCIAQAYRDRVDHLYRYNTPDVCDGPILKQPEGCDPGGSSEIEDEDVAAVTNFMGPTLRNMTVATDDCGHQYERGLFQQAESCWRNKAQKGDLEAQFQLGKLYYHGEGVAADRKQAAAWFTTAAERGHVGAQDFLAVMYLAGDGVSQSPETAIKWYESAAKAGDLSAARNLAFHFKEGRLLPHDQARALYWCNYYVDRQKKDDLPSELKEGCEKWMSQGQNNPNAENQSNVDGAYNDGTSFYYSGLCSITVVYVTASGLKTWETNRRLGSAGFATPNDATVTASIGQLVK